MRTGSRGTQLLAPRVIMLGLWLPLLLPLGACGPGQAAPLPPRPTRPPVVDTVASGPDVDLALALYGSLGQAADALERGGPNAPDQARSVLVDARRACARMDGASAAMSETQADAARRTSLVRGACLLLDAVTDPPTDPAALDQARTLLDLALAPPGAPIPAVRRTP